MITKINEFKNIFKNVWYHGSKTKINNFILDTNIINHVYNSNFDDNGLGIFFTDNKTMAESFADLIEFDPNSGKYKNTNNDGYIYNCDLNIKKPWILQEHVKDIDVDDAGQTYFDIIEQYKGGTNFRKYLLENNYDSVIVYDMTTNYYEDSTYTICIILETKNIKIKSTDHYEKV